MTVQWDVSRESALFSPKIFITVLEYVFNMLDWETKGITINGK